MKRIVAPAIVASLLVGAAFGLTNGQASAEPGEGHTPVRVCHWVPAHGGSYVEIVVDDDAKYGNANLQGHAGHQNDLVAFGHNRCPGHYID